MPRGQQQQQQSAIQKATLARPDTLRDLLSTPQKGAQHRHYQPRCWTRRKRPDHRCHHRAWWTMMSPRQTPAMKPCSGRPGTSAAWLQSPSRRRPRPPTGQPGKRCQWGEDVYYRTSVTTLTRSSTWTAAGSLARATAMEVDSTPETQQRAAASRNGPWPSTKGVCSKSWAWPGQRPAPSGADVAWRLWIYCPLPEGHRVG